MEQAPKKQQVIVEAPAAQEKVMPQAPLAQEKVQEKIPAAQPAQQTQQKQPSVEVPKPLGV